MKKIITTTEAHAIIQNEDSDFFPVRILNERGQTLVSEFVRKNASEPERINMGTYYSDAEDAAMNSGFGEAIILEIKSINSASGNPETITLDDSCFDWVI